jgi:hypothetical protein
MNQERGQFIVVIIDGYTTDFPQPRDTCKLTFSLRDETVYESSLDSLATIY